MASEPAGRVGAGAASPDRTRPSLAVPNAVDRRPTDRWQVFGLSGAVHDTSVDLPTGHRFPGRCTQCWTPIWLGVMAVVPDHRCGAVPDSHRVPSCLSVVRGRRRTSRGPDSTTAGGPRPPCRRVVSSTRCGAAVEERGRGPSRRRMALAVPNLERKEPSLRAGSGTKRTVPPYRILVKQATWLYH